MLVRMGFNSLSPSNILLNHRIVDCSNLLRANAVLNDKLFVLFETRPFQDCVIIHIKLIFHSFTYEESVMRSGDQMLQQIIEKSAVDEQFRQALLANPKMTISNELGVTIPDSMTIKIHESDMQTVHLALPPDPNITEEQLEAISAGLCCCW